MKLFMALWIVFLATGADAPEPEVLAPVEYEPASPVAVNIVSDTAGGTAFMDGLRIGVADTVCQVAPGLHQIEVYWRVGEESVRAARAVTSGPPSHPRSRPNQYFRHTKRSSSGRSYAGRSTSTIYHHINRK